MKKLVILGGGYGGMRIMQKLFQSGVPDDIKIVLVDKAPYHCFKTEFYALAAGTIPDNHIRVAFPNHPQLEFINDEVSHIDLQNNRVELQNHEAIIYDDLIIGLGCEDKYHDIPGADQYTYGIQSIEATRQTNNALNNLPRSSRVAIVGAGLSGVEIASELHESRPDLKIFLFDRGKMVLSKFPEKLSKYVNDWFQDHGVTIVNYANITKVEEGILYNHDEPMKFDCIVWTAGIRPNKVVRELDVEKDESGRVVLTPYHNIPGNEHVYVVGDCASLPFAPSAQLAEAQGDQITQVLLKRWNGEDLPDELPEIKLKGILGSLGKKQGFGLVAERPLTGRVARLLKSGILWLYKFHNG
ncbi:NAD(P)/FAD-dependent oxidoreductase [Caldibacillus thermoamylovorans]|uniref:NAD(P)/FAD-dependent oxidoreductase n=1 Tax=Caldibacillus thermoamylovorans TaxID=35841 RepID=UPI00203D5DA2|nr:NAD(P)/FAD-dependent oxidoreductase [Caldibacillus thermoamylovorans]MCM3477584.1 NAD(P)/FAD-dependent oxidoreductase [Caldibacillus thermoamylovorans]